MGAPVISVFIFLSFFIGSIHAWHWPWETLYTQVIIGNGIEYTNLSVHCRSKDDDFGVHIIPFGGEFRFRFRPNFFGGTLFTCRFDWPNNTHYFDIYDERRDRTTCPEYCDWGILPDGPYFHGAYCHPWK